MSSKPNKIYANVPDTVRGKPFVIHGDPKGNTFLYAQGNSIVVRNLENPLDCYYYTEHAVNATVARYSPSGFYIASGDTAGNVRIWDTTNEEHILKYEYRPLSGAVKDIAWSEDSKRLVVCGEGSDTFARAFLWDSGSAVGEITGHGKFINSVDFKQTRPFRVVTASEDNDTGFYAGPPFKLQHLNHEHSRFVNCVRFSPDGTYYVSGGADGKACVYDGKEGTFVKALGGDKAHEMGIYGVAWSPDSKEVITASADKTVKLWNVEANELVTTFTFGDSIDNQQLGCLWQGKHILSVQLNGHINFLDRENPSQPLRVIRGPKKAVVSAALDKDNGKIFSGSLDGRVSRYDIATGDVEELGHFTNSVLQMAVEGDQIITTCIDDTIAFTPKTAGTLSSESIKLDSQPRGLGVSGSIAFVACQKELVVFQDGKKVFTKAVGYEPQSGALAPNGAEVAVGGEDGKIYLYNVEGSTLTDKATLDASGPVLSVAYSPDGAWLASGDKNKNVFVFDASTHELKYNRWKYHTARVDCLAWTPDSQHLASGSLDTNVIIWSLSNPNKRVTIKRAHPLAGITQLIWQSDTELITAGQDGTVRSFTITHV